MKLVTVPQMGVDSDINRSEDLKKTRKGVYILYWPRKNINTKINFARPVFQRFSVLVQN